MPIREIKRMAAFMSLAAVLAIPASICGAKAEIHEPSSNEGGGGPTPSPAGASVYFIDVKDGDTLNTTTTIHFGLKGMGVAPAEDARRNSGHHHLLIDVELPPLNQPIPNDSQHLHFGAGQTEAEVTLPSGQHTLQLLLGDHKHVPHSPPVMSARIRVNVLEVENERTAGAQREPSPPGARLYFASPTNGACIPPKFLVRFGLSGMGVAPAGFKKANTGHHHLIIDSKLPAFDKPIPNDENHLHFGTGQTEAEVTLKPGHHKLQLLFGDARHIPHDPPLYSQPISVFAGKCKFRKRGGSNYKTVARVRGREANVRFLEVPE